MLAALQPSSLLQSTGSPGPPSKLLPLKVDAQQCHCRRCSPSRPPSPPPPLSFLFDSRQLRHCGCRAVEPPCVARRRLPSKLKCCRTAYVGPARSIRRGTSPRSPPTDSCFPKVAPCRRLRPVKHLFHSKGSSFTERREGEPPGKTYNQTREDGRAGCRAPGIRRAGTAV